MGPSRGASPPSPLLSVIDERLIGGGGWKMGGTTSAFVLYRYLERKNLTEDADSARREPSFRPTPLVFDDSSFLTG